MRAKAVALMAAKVFIVVCVVCGFLNCVWNSLECDVWNGLEYWKREAVRLLEV